MKTLKELTLHTTNESLRLSEMLMSTSQNVLIKLSLLFSFQNYGVIRT